MREHRRGESEGEGGVGGLRVKERSGGGRGGGEGMLEGGGGLVKGAGG